jgi:acetyl-CoA carboxylase biotin carboxyl carrier protein
MVDLNEEQIQEAVETAKRLGCTSFKIESGEVSFSAHLKQAPVEEPVFEDSGSEDAPAAEPAAPKERDIEAPVVGYLRHLDEPIQAGDKVEKGQVVAEVTALGLANDVTAPASGEIIEVLVESEEAVQYGQAVATMKVDA